MSEDGDVDEALVAANREEGGGVWICEDNNEDEVEAIILFLPTSLICDNGVMACSLFNLLPDNKGVCFVYCFFVVLLILFVLFLLLPPPPPPLLLLILVILCFSGTFFLLLSSAIFLSSFLAFCVADVFIFSRYYATRFLNCSSSG